MSTRRYGAKQRVVTASKTMRFETFYGTRNTTERQQHAEEREAKRWLKTRLDKAQAYTRTHDPFESNRIAEILSTIRGKDLMAMKSSATVEWDYTYSGMHVYCGVTRIA